MLGVRELIFIYHQGNHILDNIYIYTYICVYARITLF